MEQFPFVLTVFFMLLGPIKLIPSFGGMTRGADTRFKRAVAIRGAVIAAALCAVVAVAGEAILGKYRISIDALRISGGLVLLITALMGIFLKPPAPTPSSGPLIPIQLAASPVAVPGIVPPAGIAAILIFMMLSPVCPGLALAVGIGLAIMMVLDFLVMYFIDQVLRIPGLMLVLTVLGTVLLFVQVCLAIQMVLNALQHLGAFHPV